VGVVAAALKVQSVAEALAEAVDDVQLLLAVVAAAHQLTHEDE